MADIVNLRRARKDRRRLAAERQAEDNRVRHGMPKALRQAARVETARQARALDGAALLHENGGGPMSTADPARPEDDAAADKPPPP
ncbi:MAG: DUF4169 family protein [Aurantimonas endophytica]|uniref:DUF4169 family protein n=1 Tax=Aurantimonas endophytica TaxID=1522175 RepID=A0A7W6HBS8_9HYPH|nr:DUF4169 family protein [Aurantimonas endophytica]MBB4002258.1 hypothetical protein [Aurantimonas endophytica]MCO6402116.1 DUF4169 family protein [Aurantimonas endophytica]